MTYARVWRCAWAVLTALEIGLALLAWSPLVTAACIAMLALCATLGQLSLRSSRRGLEGGRGWRETGLRSLRIGAGVTGQLAMTEGSAPVGLLLGLLFVLTCPWTVHRFLRRTRPAPDPGAAPVPRAVSDNRAVAEVEPSIATLSDRELLRLWRSTFWDLRGRLSKDAVLDTVARRQQYLDELERRNPAAVQAWLASEARAWVGPEKFFGDDHHPGSPGSPDAA